MVQVGYVDEGVKQYGGRKEVFDIAADEQLIGCEISYDVGENFCGLTWFKMKVYWLIYH